MRLCCEKRVRLKQDEWHVVRAPAPHVRFMHPAFPTFWVDTEVPLPILINRFGAKVIFASDLRVNLEYNVVHGR